MGRISYDDWLENGTDVWVARLGAPVTLNKPISFATAHATTSGQSSAYTYAELRPHIISVENDGRLKAGGDYGSTLKEVESIFEEDIPRLLAKHTKKHLLLYAHGGLVAEEAAVQRVSEYRPALLAAGIYPLAFVWYSDYWTMLTNMLQDTVRRRRPEGFLDGSKDFLLDRLDNAIEPMARRLSGKSSWNEMKENALRASAPQGAARLIVEHVVKLKAANPDLDIHLVGHSAGAIFLAPVVQLLTSDGLIGSGPMRGATGAGLTAATCTLWAPACTTSLFKETYFPAIKSSAIGNYTQYSLNDPAERNDNCANIYHKSLLYLVSHAFETEERVPGQREGTPILGMATAIDKDSTIKDMFDQGKAELVLAPNNQPDDSLSASKARHHGDFDDDLPTVSSTFKRILGARHDVVDQRSADTSVVFADSAHSLQAKRAAIDIQTARGPMRGLGTGAV
jgi:alpha-beta hydrolase superfamily lysophospholipase